MIDVYDALEMYLLDDYELGYVSGGMSMEVPSIEDPLIEVEPIEPIAIELDPYDPCDYCEFPYGPEMCNKYCDYYW